MAKILQHPLIVFMLSTIILSYIWIFFFRNDEFPRVAGVFFLQFTGLIVSFICFFKAYYFLEKENDTLSPFWLLALFSICFQGMSWLIGAYYNLILGTSSPYPGFVDYLWIVSYLLWITALIYKLTIVVRKTEVLRFLFDISIFMVIIVSLIWELLLSNIILNLSGNLLTDIVNIAYPAMDLTLFFVTILLYFSTRNSSGKNIFAFISIGFISQIIADFIYVHQSLSETYVFGELIDPLWNITLLLKGIAALYVLEFKKTPLRMENQDSEIKHHDTVSYVLILIFLFITFIRHFEGHGLMAYAFFIVICMVTTRQVIILFQKEKALKELNILSKSLEHKTQELNNALNEVNKMARHDFLTGLPNRYMFHEYLDECIERCKQTKTELTIMFLDLDRFKFVNDTMGHASGDLLLKEVSKRLRRSIREDDMLARLGGDEFILSMENISKDEIIQIAQQIINEFILPFHLNEKDFYTSTSIGISMYPSDCTDKESLIHAADQALLCSERTREK